MRSMASTSCAAISQSSKHTRKCLASLGRGAVLFSHKRAIWYQVARFNHCRKALHSVDTKRSSHMEYGRTAEGKKEAHSTTMLKASGLLARSDVKDIGGRWEAQSRETTGRRRGGSIGRVGVTCHPLAGKISPASRSQKQEERTQDRRTRKNLPETMRKCCTYSPVVVLIPLSPPLPAALAASVACTVGRVYKEAGVAHSSPPVRDAASA